MLVAELNLCQIHLLMKMSDLHNACMCVNMLIRSVTIATDAQQHRSGRVPDSLRVFFQFLLKTKMSQKVSKQQLSAC